MKKISLSKKFKKFPGYTKLPKKNISIVVVLQDWCGASHAAAPALNQLARSAPTNVSFYVSKNPNFPKVTGYPHYFCGKKDLGPDLTRLAACIHGAHGARGNRLPTTRASGGGHGG